MSRPRRSRARGELPLHLARYDWREWREPAAPDDPFPEYGTWYLGLFDWQAACEAWARGVLVPPKIQIPRPVQQGSVNTSSAAGSRGAGVTPHPLTDLIGGSDGPQLGHVDP